MPHVTEGDLHACVDGALGAIDRSSAERMTEHLETCPDCAARLEEARAIRDESARLLDAALGDVASPPPFEAVLERAGGGAGSRGQGAGARGRRRPAPERLAWAASIVVALGAGWMGHALLDTRETPFAVAPVEIQERVGETTALESDAFTVPADRDRAAARDVGVDPTSVAEAGRIATDEVAAAPAPAQREAPARLQQAVADELAVAALGAAKSTDEIAELDGAQFDDAKLEEVAWEPISRDAAEAVHGGAVPTAAGLDVLDYAVAETPDGTRLRVRQRLPGGDALELVMLVPASVGDERARVERRLAEAEPERQVPRTPTPVDEPALETAAAAAETSGAGARFSRLWVEVNGATVRVTAPVALDSLRSLVSRIR